MIEVLADEYYLYTLERDTESDEYFLEVLCGTVALFTIRFKLNEKELANYRSDSTSIKTLAYDVLDHPFEYDERAIR